MNIHVVHSVCLFSIALSLLRGCLHDVLRQCRARIRHRYRVKCVSLEQIPAERNAATRERNTFRARFPPGLPPSDTHPLRYKQFDPKTRCGSWAEESKGPRWGRQLAELPNRARWCSLVASQATL